MRQDITVCHADCANRIFPVLRMTYLFCHQQIQRQACSCGNHPANGNASSGNREDDTGHELESLELPRQDFACIYSVLEHWLSILSFIMNDYRIFGEHCPASARAWAA